MESDELIKACASRHKRPIRHRRWLVPNWPRFVGETVFILGGGPSLKGFDAAPLRAAGKVIGVNESGLTLAPWCDILYWADRRWFEWNEERLHLHTGMWKFTSVENNAQKVRGCQYIHWMPRERVEGHSSETWIGLQKDPNLISGFDGGSRAINIAYHCGAARVVLLGFDMRDYPMDKWQKGNWHKAHPMPPQEGQRAAKFIPAHNRMQKDVAKIPSFDVFNATPDSAIECWPKMDLEEFLR